MNNPFHETTHIYCDGGCISKNPSPHGGTWAYVLLQNETVLKEDSGIILPTDVRLPTVSNNISELIAALNALNQMSDGWAGTIHTDSMITMFRVSRKNAALNGVPPCVREYRKQVLQRMGRFDVVLLNGHPTAQHLRENKGHGGLPVSKWNVLCDEMCGEEAYNFLNTTKGKIEDPDESWESIDDV